MYLEHFVLREISGNLLLQCLYTERSNELVTSKSVTVFYAISQLSPTIAITKVLAISELYPSEAVHFWFLRVMYVFL